MIKQSTKYHKLDDEMWYNCCWNSPVYEITIDLSLRCKANLISLLCYLHWHPPISNLISRPDFASPDWNWSTPVVNRLFPLISFVSDFLYSQQFSAQCSLKASFFCCSVWIAHRQSGGTVTVRLLKKQSCCSISVLTCHLRSTEWLRTVNHILAFS